MLLEMIKGMHFGFSYTGLIYLAMLMLPNMIWTKNKPEGYEAFLVLAVYGKNVLLGAAVVILGIGHIGIHLMHRREIAVSDL